MKKRLQVLGILVCILTIGLAATACSGGAANDERAAIEETIRGYVTTFNSGEFAQCLTYFADYGEEEDALAFLSQMRVLAGELRLRQIKDTAIFPSAVPGGGRTATVTVVFTIAGEEGTDQMQLKEVDGNWMILWKQESLP